MQHATPEMWGGEIYPEEQDCVPNVATKRYREFTAGRLCAREVLKKSGIDNFPLLVGNNREPLWPPGIVGSISHCRDNCIVVASRDKRIAGLGVDIENIAPLEEEITSLVCRQKEKQWITHVSEPGHPDWAKIIFSAKESVYKCLFPIKNIYLDFKEVQIEFDILRNKFSIDLFNREVAEFIEAYVMVGHFYYTNKYVYTGAELRRIE